MSGVTMARWCTPRHSTIPEAGRAGLQGEVWEVTPTVCLRPVDSSPRCRVALSAGRALPEDRAAELTVGFTAVVIGGGQNASKQGVIDVLVGLNK